jgi:valyl-tRNA synthetase
MNDAFLSPYNHSDSEPVVQELWDSTAYANPDVMIADGLVAPDAETFSIVLPPPNVTGTLHTGHAYMLAIEDTMVRYQRMLGKRTLWIPGTDHAAIATQSKVEKLLAKDKISKHDLGRDAFLDKVREFAQESQDTILSQVRSMGASVDWTRLAYTLDEERHHAVYTAFKRMYDDGLIYRDYRIVNWDPKGQTVISDDEVVHVERDAVMYTFKYSKDFPFAIATTRPETKVGDTAVAVHPDDARYQEYIGKTYETDFCGAKISITVVADDHVDPEFGTGALGVTPAHSGADWDIAQRNKLPYVQVINEYAKMTNCGEILEGLKVEQARETVIAWLREQGLIEQESPIKQNVATAERTGGIIEPLPKLQWWIDTEKSFAFPTDKITGIEKGQMVTLKEAMLHVVHQQQIKILPERFEKVYFNWIENLRPWNISRQIWFGHRIPVWYRGEEIYVDTKAPAGDDWVQDEDTLDTWFSSGLWTFSTLGWPEQTEDFKNYHPTQVLETGHDIIFFWVARMILMSLYHVGDVPFETVYLHGLIRDSQGRKMSKSLGNIVDPLDLTKIHGTDALRMGMIVGNGPGNDVNLDEQKIKAYSKFANKLWNIARYTLTEASDADIESRLTEADEAIMNNHKAFFAEITPEMNDYKLYLVSEKLYHYAWHTFADEIIESSKDILAGEDHVAIQSRKKLLLVILKDILRGLHPFMPFVTENVWQHMPRTEGERKMLMIEKWPNTTDEVK